MALTLVEASKQGGTDVQRAVIEMFARSSDILRVLPFTNIQGNALTYNREGTLPGIAFRGVNEGYTESVGALNPVTEALAIVGGDCDVDKFIVQTVGPETRAAHVGMKIKKLADSWTTKFIKGDVTSDPREFDGLQRRVTGAQIIDAGSTSGGDALSLKKMDEAIDAVDAPTHLIMSKAMRRLFSAAARLSTVAGNVNYTVDEFGRTVTTYNGLPILVPYSANGGTEPLAFDEAGAGGGSTATSIYVCSFGEGRLGGIQNGTIQAADLGEQDSKPVYRTRVEWYAGIALWHGRAVSRLRGISNAAIVA